MPVIFLKIMLFFFYHKNTAAKPERGMSMLYIERDADGTITAIYNAPQANAREEKTAFDDEILDFLNNAGTDDPKKLLLSLSDKGMIRLVEDLIDLLIRKKVILYTELPQHAQEKMKERARLRKTADSDILMADDIL